MGMVEAFPEASRLLVDEIEGVQILNRIRKLVVMTMVRCPPNDAFLGVCCREKSFNELHDPEVPFFLAWRPNKPFKPVRHLVLKGTMRKIAVPESGDKEHAPITIHQADHQHRNAAKEPVLIPETGSKLVEYPRQADNPEQINDKKAALVEDILDADLLPHSQFIFF